MYGKPLMYVVKVDEINPIEGADRLEAAKVMDYTVVVKKGEFVPGDLALYVEIDSLLPDGLSDEDRAAYVAAKENLKMANTDEDQLKFTTEIGLIQSRSKYPYFEFLRDKKFKIKSIKLRGQISQGILFKPSDLGIDSCKLGEDFTTRFNVTEIVQDAEEAGLVNDYKKSNFVVKFLMRFAWFRAWRKRKNIKEVWNPTWPGKSDEENVQKVFAKMKAKYADKEWVATEKLEGQNITIFSEEVKTLFGKKDKRIGVCSRTRELNPKGNSAAFWDTVKRERLDEKIKAIPGEWFCRGEHLGPGIQGNIYQLPRTTVRFFDFYKKEDGEWNKLNFEDSVKFAEQYDLPFVPVLDEHYKLPETAQEMLAQSDKKTVFGNNLKHKREGFVLRLKDDYNVSFKVKNPFYEI